MLAYGCFPAASAWRPEPEKTWETFKNNVRQQPCAFGHWCAARHCMVNANIGTAIAGFVAVVPFGNGHVCSMIPPPLDTGLLHPSLRSPNNRKGTALVREILEIRSTIQIFLSG